MYQKYARFSELRPTKVDTNLFTYHLNCLLKGKIVEKRDGGGYTLTPLGLAYVDRVSGEKMLVRKQPKIITMLVGQNADGQVILHRRKKQPYIDTWTLPYGKLHIEDRSALEAARREAKEKLGLGDIALEHAGDCYIRVNDGQDQLSVTLAHIFRFYVDDIEVDGDNIWVSTRRLHELDLAPAVSEVVARTFFRDPFFFEEFEVEWPAN